MSRVIAVRGSCDGEALILVLLGAVKCVISACGCTCTFATVRRRDRYRLDLSLTFYAPCYRKNGVRGSPQ